MTRNAPNAFARHPWLTRCCLCLLVFVVFDYGAAQYVQWNRDRLSPNIKDFPVPYEYGLKANMTSLSAVWGHRVYRLDTNSLGFRDRSQRDVSLTTNACRLVFIGDSFTLGIGCDYGDTFVGLVDNALAEHGIDVLNAAVDGYSAVHYYRKMVHYIETLGFRFDELVCCIDLSDVSEDLMVLGREAAHEKRHRTEGVQSGNGLAAQKVELPALPHVAGLRHKLRRNSLFVDLLYRVKLIIAPVLPLDQEAILWTSDDRLYQKFGRQGVDTVMANIEQLHMLLKRHGIRLTIVVYPWADQILRRDLDSRQVRIWREWCASHGARFIDCFPAFVGRDADPMDTVYECFIRGDNHFNEAGHRIMAEKLLEHLLTGEKNSREKAQEDST